MKCFKGCINPLRGCCRCGQFRRGGKLLDAANSDAEAHCDPTNSDADAHLSQFLNETSSLRVHEYHV